MDEITKVMAKYKSNGHPLMGVKIDYLAERSIPDNITLETS